MNLFKSKNYPSTLVSCPASTLPFINENSYWNVRRPESYDVSREIGVFFAAHYIKYLSDNSESIEHGSLFRIMEDMAKNENAELDGYARGFLQHVEKALISAGKSTDIFTDAHAHADKMVVENRKANMEGLYL